MTLYLMSENETENLRSTCIDAHLAHITDFDTGYLENHLAYLGQ